MFLFTIYLAISSVELISRKVAVIFFKSVFYRRELVSFQSYCIANKHSIVVISPKT